MFDSPGLLLSLEGEGIEIGISARRAVQPLTAVTGNIWMLENVDR